MKPERPELCVGAVVVDADRLLLVRRARPPGVGQWSVPGGRVEWGETMAEAVVRELAEETSIVGVCGELIGWVERIAEVAHHVVFDFRVVALEAIAPVPGDDVNEAAWVPLANVGSLGLVEGLADFLHDHDIVELIA